MLLAWLEKYESMGLKGFHQIHFKCLLKGNQNLPMAYQSTKRIRVVLNTDLTNQNLQVEGTKIETQ